MFWFYKMMTSAPRHHRRYYIFIIAFLICIPSLLSFKRIGFHLQSSIYNENETSITEDISINISGKFPEVRTNRSSRCFTSSAVESLIREIQRNIKNEELAWLFGNSFPNTLDTTVNFSVQSTGNQRPDTYVIIGDVDAMSLRDSSVQIHPYLPLMKKDTTLRQMVEGVLLRQLIFIQRDPYANAHYKDINRISQWKSSDNTDMVDGVQERKWGLDSLCYVLRLMYSYWKEVNHDLAFFRKNEKEFKKTIGIILSTMKEQRRFNGTGGYTFQRQGSPPDSRGNSARPNGLIYSYFRPSDDLQIYPYLIPSQFFAYHTLTLLSELVRNLKWTVDFNQDIVLLLFELRAILFSDDITKNDSLITTNHEKYGYIYAYEINGIENQNIMDDASVPSLLSLPYLCPTEFSINDTIYQNTRKFALSRDNPWYFTGQVLSGISGTHVGGGMVSPLAIIMRGLTTNNDTEIRLCLKMLQKSHGGAGFMHGAVNIDDPTQFSRPRFAGANSLFGEFIWKLYREKPYLLNEVSPEEV